MTKKAAKTTVTKPSASEVKAEAANVAKELIGKTGGPATPAEPAPSSPSAPPAPSATEVKVSDVQSKLEVAQAEMVDKLAHEIIQAHGAVAGKYWELITYIRKHEVSPKLVSIQLGKLGFKKTRVSEINRIANAADDVFSQYEAKLIGFDKALEMARIEDKKGAVPTPAAEQLVKDGSLTQDEASEAVIDAEATKGGNARPPQPVSMDDIKAKIKWIARHYGECAELPDVKTWKFTDEGCTSWAITVKRI